MATTPTVVANQALQLIGTRTNIASLSESSNEAIAVNLVYGDVLDWCLALANWNFARMTAAILASKQITASPPPQPWSNAEPPPPWIYVFPLPTDFIRARYVTNSDINTTATLYLGESKRFAVATDPTSLQTVLMFNQNPAILVYTQRVVDTTRWPGYFERLMVAALAASVCLQLSGDRELFAALQDFMMKTFMMAEGNNREEGLIYRDTTPEWIRAIGIDYSQQRLDNRALPPQPQSKGAAGS